jgi:hypothetical protein
MEPIAKANRHRAAETGRSKGDAGHQERDEAHARALFGLPEGRARKPIDYCAGLRRDVMADTAIL